MGEASGARISDAELLRVCATAEGSAAFEELICRHGQTVFAVCRGILGDGPDADDAFQATFLVLLQRASSVKHPAALSGWLCGVAARVAHRIRQRRARTWARNTTVDSINPTTANEPQAPPSADPVAAAMDQETRAALWAELGALPDKYRDPLVLCYFQDLTTEQAATALHCPVGTLRSRLLKGRQLLHTKLLRRGVTVSIAGVLVGLTESRAAVSPTPDLIQQTTAVATGAASPRVTQLAREVAQQWIRSWSAAAVAAILLLILMLVGLFLTLGQTKPDRPDSDEAAGNLGVGGGTLLVVSQQAATVSLIDVTSGRTRATIQTDPCPHEVPVSDDGKLAAVANYGLPFGAVRGGTITLIDVAKGTKLKSIAIGVMSAPHGLCWLDNNRLLCTVEKNEAVVEIDVSQGKVTRTLITAQQGTHMVVATKQRAFTANALSGTVSSLDLEKGEKLRDRPVGNGPEGIAVSPDGTRVWVGNRAENTLSILSAEDLSVVKTLRAPGMPLRLAFTPNGDTVVVTQILSGELALFDAETMVERKRVAISGGEFVFDPPSPHSGPAAVAFSADGKLAYCTMFLSGALAVIDVETGMVTGKINVKANAIDGIAFSPIHPIDSPSISNED